MNKTGKLRVSKLPLRESRRDITPMDEMTAHRESASS